MQLFHIRPNKKNHNVTISWMKVLNKLGIGNYLSLQYITMI